MNAIWLLLFLPTSFITAYWGLPKQQAARHSILFFYSCYSVTTCLGGTLIGLNDGLILNYYVDSANSQYFTLNTVDFGYWVLLFMPFIITPITIKVIETLKFTPSLRPRIYVKLNLLLYFYIFCNLLVIFILYSNNLYSAAFENLAFSFDYLDEIKFRRMLPNEILGGSSLFLIWAFLPVSALFLFLKRHRFSKFTSYIIVFFFLNQFINCIVLHQKAYLLLFIVLIPATLLSFTKLSIKPIIWIAISIMILTFAQMRTNKTWTVGDSITHIVYRLAQSFPYYYALYPRYEPFQEFGYGGYFIGRTPVNDNVQVFKYMGPSVTAITGNASAANHVRAYSAGGFVISLISCAFCAITLYAISYFHTISEDKLKILFTILGIYYSYFFSQTSFYSAMFETIGLVKMLIILIPFTVLRRA